MEKDAKMAETFERTVRWQGWDGTGLEHLVLRADPGGAVAESLVIGERGGVPFGLRYMIETDPAWRVRELRVNVLGGASLDLVSDGAGRWTGAGGVEMLTLEGCIDVDIGATPFTNTLALRRLALEEGQSAETKVAYVPLPKLAPEPVGQRYTRIAGDRYRYEGLFSKISLEIAVDEDGLVTEYMGAFRRLPTAGEGLEAAG